MDFALTPDQERFREQVRSFLTSPPVQAALRDAEQVPPLQEPHPTEVYRWLGERGWWAANWPTELGGLDSSPVEAAIVSEELGLAGVPDTVHVNTVDIVGLFLLLAGTEDQQRRFLPPIARGETVVSVLYTEPQAGSDLGSLTTRADRRLGGYTLYGRKIYSLKTHIADYGLCAARTTADASKYDGITLFMVPLDAPGVEVRPVWSLHDERFNEVILAGAEVDEKDVIGPVGQAWPLINAALAIERTGLDYYVKARRWLDFLRERVRASGQWQDPQFGPQLASLEAQVEAGRLLAWRMISQLAEGDVSDVAAATAKWYNSELARPVTRLALDMEGPEGTLSRWDGDAPARGVFEAAWRETPGLTLSAGTSEIMLSVIASVGLQLRA